MNSNAQDPFPPRGRVVIVGASLAGSRAAASIRAAGHDGPITLIGAEAHLPYDRPPLSKEFLTAEGEPDPPALDPAGAYDELGVEFMGATAAVGLDLKSRIVAIARADGTWTRAEALPFDGLVIATGTYARRLPGTPDISGVHLLRTLDDARALRAGLVAGAKVAVVGAGFIGSEVAASAKARGCEVTVIEAAPAPLMRGLGAELGALVGGLHPANGVDLRLGTSVESVLGRKHVKALALSDGSRLETDMVVVGVGVVPSTDWLEGSGLRIDNGVVCDATLCCGPPGVYAIGDVARAPNGWLAPWHGDAPIRVEHWTAAVEHAMTVGKNLLDPASAQPYSSVPFVWSDQYDARIQIAGHPDAFDPAEVLVGSEAEGAFLAGYRRGDSLSGVMALNAIRPFVRFRRLLAGHPSWRDALELAAELA